MPVYGQSGLAFIDPKESDDLKMKIKKVHLLYQAAQTKNLALFKEINVYFKNGFSEVSTIHDTITITEIWKSLPDNYKVAYDFIFSAIKNHDIDLFYYLCFECQMCTDYFYSSVNSKLNRNIFIYEYALYILRDNKDIDIEKKSNLTIYIILLFLKIEDDSLSSIIQKKIADTHDLVFLQKNNNVESD